MKFLRTVVDIMCLAVLCIIASQCSKEETLTHDIKSSEPFMFHGKEWECGYTPKQVDINILEEKIQELKK